MGVGIRDGVGIPRDEPWVYLPPLLTFSGGHKMGGTHPAGMLYCYINDQW